MVKIGFPFASPVAFAARVAVAALPAKSPVNLVATNSPAVVPKYTPVSAIEVTPAAVAVGVEVVASKYALLVVPRVTLTFVSDAAIVTVLNASLFLFFNVKVLPDSVKLLA